MLSRPALLAAPIAAVLLIGLTACSGSAGGGTSSAAASAPAAAKPSAAATTAAAAPAGPVDACKLLPVATVAKAMGIAYVTSEAENGETGECGYDTKGISLDHLVFEIQTSGGRSAESDDLQVIGFEGDKPITLTGLGDSAYEAPEGSDVRIEKAFGALWGDTYLTVGGPITISETQARALLTAAHDAL